MPWLASSRARNYHSTDVIFLLFAVSATILSTVPLMANDRDPAYYDIQLSNDLQSGTGICFIHSVLVAITVSVTLCSDLILDGMYGNRILDNFAKQRWFLLIALGVPNAVMYFLYVVNSLSPGEWIDSCAYFCFCCMYTVSYLNAHLTVIYIYD